jgi:hypothetical protein
MILDAMETRRIELIKEFKDIHNEPFIINDFENLKPALGKWGFKFFQSNFGDEMVILCDDAANTKKYIKSKLKNYINYILNEPNDLPSLTSEKKWYLANWKILEHSSQLRDDFKPHDKLIDFFPSLSPLNSKWHYGKLGWLFMGPAGTTTFPHKDILGTHAWLSQITGKKIVRILSKSVEQEYISTQSKKQLPWVWEAELNPGQTLFIPSNTVHEALAVTDSISLSFNFMNHSNQDTVIQRINAEPDLWQRIIKETGITWPN